MKTVIVGAGPSGLVACKTLLESRTPAFPFDPIVLEEQTDVGGTFRYRSYEDATLVSSKQLTCFSDFRAPIDSPDYLTLAQYVDYLSAYSVAFKVQERIRFRSRVVRITRHPSEGHLVSYISKPVGSDQWDTNPITIHAAYLVICAGLHVTPAIPTIPGIEHVLNPHTLRESGEPKPEIYHSTHFKSRSQLKGRRCLILGAGETAMDIAYHAAKGGAKEVVLATRSGFVSFPKILNGFKIFGVNFGSKRPLPVDLWTNNFAETAYVHPWISGTRFRWILSDFVIKRILWLLTGTMNGCGQWIGERPVVGRAYGFLNKSSKAMPYINRPYRTRSSWRDFISSYIEVPEDSPPYTDFVVDLAPFPTHVLPSGRVVFPVSQRKDSIRMADRDFRPDTVIYATGYQQTFGFLDKQYAIPGEMEMRNITSKDDHTVAFIGFVRPSLGAIPPLAEMSSMWWISLIKGEIAQPLSPSHYHLLVKEDARIKYGVDHSAYISTLAKDIGAAPGLWQLWREYGTQVLVCYCFGAAVTPFYRLVGPYRDPKASHVITTELWETITRRSIAVNMLVGLFPMVFYSLLSLMALCAEKALSLLRI